MTFLVGAFAGRSDRFPDPKDVAAMAGFYGALGYRIRAVEIDPRLHIAFISAPSDPAADEAVPVRRIGNIIYFGQITLYGRESCEPGCPQDALAAVAAHFERDGASGLGRLNGDFVLGMFDCRSGALRLCCDQLGIRACYYSEAGRQLYFASSAQALLHAQGVDRSLDEVALAGFLLKGEPGVDRTFYKSIRQLLPSTLLIAGERSEDAISLRSYWKPRTGTFGRGLPDHDLLAAFREELVRSVISRVPETGPTGIFLSGGLDSSAIAGIACSHHPDRQFISSTAGLPQDHASKETDERAFVSLVRERHTNLEAMVDDGEGGNVLAAPAQQQLRGPQGNPACWSNRRQFESLQQRGVRVVLTGDGGDDFVSAHGQAYLIDRLLRWRFLSARAEARRLRAAEGIDTATLLKRYIVGPLVPMPLLRWSRKLRSLDWTEGAVLRRDAFASLRMEEWLRVTGKDARLLPESSVRGELLANARSCITGGGFSYDDLDALGTFVTVRLPLIDVRLVEAVLSMPTRFFVSAGENRRLIRLAAAPYLPSAIARRRDKGLGTPSFRRNMEASETVLRASLVRFARNDLWTSLVDVRKVEEGLAGLRRASSRGNTLGLALKVLRPMALGRFLEFYERWSDNGAVTRQPPGEPAHVSHHVAEGIAAP